jgi:TonB family protein
MSPIAMQVLERLADVSVRVILLAGIAWPAAKLVRTAAARHGIWCALLAGMLALPILAPLLPPIHSGVVMRYTPTFAGFRASAPRLSTRRSASRTASTPVPPQPLPRWAMLLAFTYLTVVLALLTRLVLAYRLSGSLVRNSEPIRDEHPRKLMEDLRSAQSLPWPLPQLRASHAVVVPVTIGWRVPVVVLPADWPFWDGWKLYAVLAHELAHIRRADWLITVAGSLNRCLFWFHPLAWWLERHLSALSEQACDEAALHTVTDATRYARAVLEFAAALQGGRRLAYGVAMARTAKVSRRINRILELRTPGPGVMKKSTWVAVLACALPLVYTAAAIEVTRTATELTPRPGLAQMLTEGSKLSAADAEELERQLARDSDDPTARAKLISYYFAHDMADPAVEHIYRLIEQHPESEVAVYYSKIHVRSSADAEHLKSLWLEEVASHPDHAQILANAASYIGETDQFAEEDLLKRARQIEPSNAEWIQRLADLLAREIFHSLLLNQIPVVPHVDSSFADAAKTELETSGDAILVGTVGEFLAGGPPGGPQPVPAQQDFAEHLLSRAQALGPDNPEWPAALARLHAARENPPSAAIDSSGGAKRIRVGSQVQQSNLLQSVDPVYPALAFQSRIQGVVRFHVTIRKDGHISNLTLISGHPLLVAAAQEALKQWVYRPTLLNGDPIEVHTIVDVPFTLPPAREN